jgi:hypothetical protein
MVPFCFCAVFSPKDRESRKPRGFTFCQYRRKEDAADAVKGMDKRVGTDCSHTPLWWGWTGCVFSLICVTFDTPDLCLKFSDTTDSCHGVVIVHACCLVFQDAIFFSSRGNCILWREGGGG